MLRYTLVADGTSDQVLIPILDWLIGEHLPDLSIVSAFARDFGNVGHDLRSRVKAAVHNFPSDLLFIHRDAETQSRERRLAEINAAMHDVKVHFVPVIPVRMTEAWLLADEKAIRFAAQNASSRIDLGLPARRRWEELPDPKAVLLLALKAATERRGRALDKFSAEKARHLIAPRTSSFELLRGLPAFDALETDLINQLRKMNYALD